MPDRTRFPLEVDDVRPEPGETGEIAEAADEPRQRAPVRVVSQPQRTEKTPEALLIPQGEDESVPQAAERPDRPRLVPTRDPQEPHAAKPELCTGATDVGGHDHLDSALGETLELPAEVGLGRPPETDLEQADRTRSAAR